MLTLIVEIDPHTALRTGSRHAGELRLALDPAQLSTEQRALLQLYTRADGAALKLGQRQPPADGGQWYSPRSPEAATVAAVLDACEACEARVRVAQAEREAEVSKELAALPDPADLSREGWLNYARSDERGRAWSAARDAALRTAADAHVAGLLALPLDAGCDTDWIEPYAVRNLVTQNREIIERRRQVLAAAAARGDAQRAEEDAMRRAETASCVANWGDANQRDRFAAGYLPEAEVETLIASSVLRPLADLALYTRVEWGDLDHDTDCAEDDRDLSCEVSDATELTREQYDALRRIRALAEEATGRVDGTLTLAVRAHVCSCDSRGCAAELTRLGVLVRIAWGRLSVAREYALGDVS